MKKILSLLASVLIFGGLAFADGNFTKGTNPKILVAYYSDTGTTQGVAQKIADYLGADLLKIESANPYSDSDLNWSNKSSRVVKEHDVIFGSKGNGKTTASDMKKISSKVAASSVINLSQYDTVFIGYPIWWGIAAWPVNGFVTQNDLSGKKVVPFCTSMSSGLGQSDKVLRDVALGKGTWAAGKRFGTRASVSEVREWVDSLRVK